MSEADTPWSRLSSRVARVVLARKDFTYAELVDALAAEGNTDGERALVSRISRGTLKLSLLLQIVSITGATPPERWTSALRTEGSWEQKAQAVIGSELARQPVFDFSELARRLANIGATVPEKTLEASITTGNMPLALFLQLLLALGSDSLERYVDYEDLLDAAKATSVD
ncbi:DUF6471 domain-containing protein [Paraburkholderia susongensis]|uniref:DUF6471 domain-containing protein n=1 Tax=Paraburkholderia susongensis TaxID=1515439 RepID=A0A1X7KH50_9BURK|nr:DUF6471 domain-containing protein [Paraburkholderia susongensis]SMG39878.1 hypothetical protein SAMN06265784_103721 [Paraburkholderia susongensis]